MHFMFILHLCAFYQNSLKIMNMHIPIIEAFLLLLFSFPFLFKDLKIFFFFFSDKRQRLMPVILVTGGWERKDHSSRPARANSFWDPILKIPNTEKGRQMVQGVECLCRKCEALSSNPSTAKAGRKKGRVRGREERRKHKRIEGWWSGLSGRTTA
jgi:hypothetical protein